MKYLMMLLTCASALANEAAVEFNYTGREHGYEAYYSCSWAVEEAQRYLKILDTTDVQIDCEGGLIPSDPSRPMKLTASFNLMPVQAKVIEVRPDPWLTTCGLSSSMIKAFLKAMPHIEVLEKRDRCSHPRNPFYFKLKVRADLLS